MLRALQPRLLRSLALAARPRLLSTTVPLEPLGDSITTAVLIKWSKKVGRSLYLS